MPIIIAPEKPKFDPVPAGVHHAVIQSIVDLGTHVPSNPKYATVRKLQFTWELVEETFTDKDGETHRRRIYKDFTLSLGEKANLRKMLNDLRGRDVNAAELKSFNTDTLLGLNCFLNVVHQPKKSDPTAVYAAVKAVVPLHKGIPPRTSDAPLLSWNIPETGPILIPESIPEWMADKIRASEEYKARQGSVPATKGLGSDTENPY